MNFIPSSFIPKCGNSNFAARLLVLFLIVLFVLSTEREPEKEYDLLSDSAVQSNQQANGLNGNKITVNKEIPTFVISCGKGKTDGVEEMQPLLKSILALSSRAVRIIFLTDELGVQNIQRIFRENISFFKRPMSIFIYLLESDDVDKWASAIPYDPQGHHSKRWGTAKLMLPWLFSDLNKAIILDTDMVFLEDPISLWNYFHAPNAAYMVYSMPVFNISEPARMCSCVVLVNCANARRLAVYPEIMKKSLQLQPNKKWFKKDKNHWRPQFGDQGLYWSMMLAYPNLFRNLPRKWDIDRCHHYLDALKNASKLPVSILHRNCDFFSKKNEDDDNEKASPFFDFYANYRWSWFNTSSTSGFPVRIKIIKKKKIEVRKKYIMN